MKKIMIFSIILLSCLIFAFSVAGESLKPQTVPVDAEWLVHIDIEKLNSSSVADLVLGIRNLRHAQDELKRIAKIDPIKDLTAVTVYGTGRDEDDTIVCVRGKLNRERLETLLSLEEDLEEITYGKYTILHWDSHEYGVFVNDGTVLIGSSQAMLKRALDTFEGKIENFQSSPLNSNLAKTPASAFIFGAAQNVSTLLGAEEGPVFLRKAGMAFFMAAESSRRLNLRMQLDTDSQKTADQIESILRGFIALANLEIDSSDPEMKVLEALEIKSTGKVVEMSLQYPTDELIDIVGSSRKLKHIIGKSPF